MKTLALLTLLLPLACGSESDDGSSPSEQCNDFGQRLCEINATCAVEVAEISASEEDRFVANCVSGFKQALDCSRVTRVTGHPDACEADMAATPCEQYVTPTGLPLAASCQSIFE